jgi:hypothetical protein
VALLVLRGAIVAGRGVGGLINFGEVQGEVGGDVGVSFVDAAVEDGNADAFAHGDVPGTVGRGARDVVAVASYLLDGPTLRGVGVVGVVGRWRGWRRWGDGMNWAVGGQSTYGRAGVGCLGSGAAFRSRGDELGAELVCGDDAVVKNGYYIWLDGEAAHGSGIVLLVGGGLDDGDTQVLVALGEASAC